jgi:hypothetical protein
MENALRELAAAWKGEGRRLRERYGQEGMARVCEAHAQELVEAIERELDAVLTLSEAARWSGYSKSHLRSLCRSGVLKSVGRKGAPRFRRGDLPRKDCRRHTSTPSPKDSIRLRDEEASGPRTAARAAAAKLTARRAT